MNNKILEKINHPYFIIPVFIIIISILLYLITVPSIGIMESNVSRRIEINRLYEQWLITEYSAFNYLTSNKNKILKMNLEKNIKSFEIGFYIFVNNLSFQELKNKYPEIAVKSSRVIDEWQYIRNYLEEIVKSKNNYKTFETQIYWIANDTAGFENNLKSITIWFDNHNKKQFRVYWNLVLLLSVVSVVIAVFFILYIRKFISAKALEIKAKKLLNSVVHVREKERLNVALEIHDTIIQDMVFSKMLCMDLLNSKNKQTQQKNLVELTDNIINSIQQIRDISFNLRPPDFDKDIVNIILSYLKDFKIKTGIDVETSFNGIDAINFDDPLKLNIYRIVQESFRNIRKHSKATKAKVSLLVSYPYIILKIYDNGKGFDVNSANQISDGKTHSGIKGIVERVKMFDGELKINSKNNDGVFINIQIPIKDKFNEE